MDLISTLKAEIDSARKNSDKFTLLKLQTLLGEIQKKEVLVGGVKTVPAEEQLKTVRKFISNAEEVIDALGPNHERSQEFILEIDLYKKFLPAALTKEEVISFLESQGIDYSDKSKIGMIMGLSRKHFGDRFEGGAIKSFIS